MSDDKHDDKHTGVSKAIDKAQDATAAAVGQASASTAGSRDAQSFVNNAAQGDVFEIESSRLAMERSASDAVKQVAEQMVNDHTEASAKLETVLTGLSTDDVDAPKKELDARRQGMLDNLKAASDEDFDKTYLDQQLAAHEEATTLFSGYRDHGDNNALRAFAAELAPVLEGHLENVKAIRQG